MPQKTKKRTDPNTSSTNSQKSITEFAKRPDNKATPIRQRLRKTYPSAPQPSSPEVFSNNPFAPKTLDDHLQARLSARLADELQDSQSEDSSNKSTRKDSSTTESAEEETEWNENETSKERDKSESTETSSIRNHIEELRQSRLQSFDPPALHLPHRELLLKEEGEGLFQGL
jgi:hypothetical protein